MKYIFFTFITILFAAQSAYAATVSIEPSAPAAPPSTQFALTITVTTDSNPINVVEGSVRIPPDVTVDAISTAGSAFTLWPLQPEFVTNDGKIEFSGGAPGGVPAGTRAILFTVYAHTDIADSYVFQPTGITAYRNDGKGTREPIAATGASIDVRPGATPAPLKASPLKATPLTANVGNDPALFDGQYFVSFYGGDRGKGVSYYEVQEGVFESWNRADRFYVLKNQSLNREIFVRAVDEDGVSAKTTIHAPNGNRVFAAFGIGALSALLIAACFFLLRRFLGKRRSA